MILKFHDHAAREHTGAVLGARGMHVMVDVTTEQGRSIQLVGRLQAVDPQEWDRVFTEAGGKWPVDENGDPIR